MRDIVFAVIHLLSSARLEIGFFTVRVAIHQLTDVLKRNQLEPTFVKSPFARYFLLFLHSS
jgi:hypothetical protein